MGIQGRCVCSDLLRKTNAQLKVRGVEDKKGLYSVSTAKVTIGKKWACY